MTELEKKNLNKFTKQYSVGSGNFLSQAFFFWVFQLITILRRTKDIKELLLTLRKSETSDYNDKLLEVEWTKEKERAAKFKVKPTITRAIFKAFGLTFVLNGLFKILWGISLWLGAYWLLKQTVALVRDITNVRFKCVNSSSNLYLYI